MKPPMLPTPKPETEVTTKKIATTRRPTTTTKATVTYTRPSATQPSSKRPPSTVANRKTTTTTQVPSVEEYPEIPDLDDERTCIEGRLFLPHETDCNKYYQCDHGNLVQLR